MSLEHKKTMDSHLSRITNQKLPPPLLVVLIWCPDTAPLRTPCIVWCLTVPLTITSICSHGCPFNPKLPRQHHESPISKARRARIERLLSASFEAQSGIKAPSQHYIIEMILKATCPLWLGFPNAFPHYLPQNGTCCCTPRRIDALSAARAKQRWAADGFRPSQSDSECFLPAAV